MVQWKERHLWDHSSSKTHMGVWVLYTRRGWRGTRFTALCHTRMVALNWRVCLVIVAQCHILDRFLGPNRIQEINCKRIDTQMVPPLSFMYDVADVKGICLMLEYFCENYSKHFSKVLIVIKLDSALLYAKSEFWLDCSIVLLDKFCR